MYLIMSLQCTVHIDMDHHIMHMSVNCLYNKGQDTCIIFMRKIRVTMGYDHAPM